MISYIITVAEMTTKGFSNCFERDGSIKAYFRCNVDMTGSPGLRYNLLALAHNDQPFSWDM